MTPCRMISRIGTKNARINLVRMLPGPIRFAAGDFRNASGFVKILFIKFFISSPPGLACISESQKRNNQKRIN
jgi:hypothetical protein